MKWYPKKDRRSDLQKEIDRVYSLMESLNPVSDEYEKVQDRYCALMEQKLKEKSKLPSVDTISNGLVTIGGLWMILHHEQFHVITSKGLQLITGRFRRS